MNTETSSARIRNYAVASFFLLSTVFAIVLFLKVVSWTNAAPATIWSECTNEFANVFIGAEDDIKDVKCISLDKEFFRTPEISLGDLSKNDEDVCRFVLAKTAAQPLRFEIRYNNHIKREVCNWQGSGFAD